MIAIHLAQWLSPDFHADVTDMALRFASGDLSLVPEVVARHDVMHDTTSVVMVQSVDNKILEQERENIARRAALELQKESLDVEERAVVVRCKSVQVRQQELDTSTRELQLDRERTDEQCRKHELFERAQQSKDTYVRLAARDAYVGGVCDQMQKRKDFSDMLRELKIPMPHPHERNVVLSMLGRRVAKKFAPDGSAQKFCGGKPRDVKTYNPEQYDAIKQFIWELFVDGTFDSHYGGRRNLSDELLDAGGSNIKRCRRPPKHNTRITDLLYRK